MQGTLQEMRGALRESETARLARFGHTEVLRRLALLRQPRAGATPPVRRKAGQRWGVRFPAL